LVIDKSNKGEAS